MKPPKNMFLHLGGRGKLGPALELMIRRNSSDLQNSGFCAPSSRIHRPLLRKALDPSPTLSETDLLQSLAIAPGCQSVFISNQHAWASPDSVISRNEVYPDAKRKSANLAAAFPSLDVTLLIEVSPLPTLLSSFENEELLRKVKSTSWAELYEFSWAELARQILVLAPRINIEILPCEVVPRRLAALMAMITGQPLKARLRNEYHLVFEGLSPKGRMILKRLLNLDIYRGQHLPEIELDRLATEALPSLATDLLNELGMDQQTCDVLNMNYRKDLSRLAEMNRVRVWE